MNNKEILLDAYDVLKAAPKEKFIIYTYKDGHGGFCALGWYGRSENGYLNHSKIERLRVASAIAYNKLHGYEEGGDIACINNRPEYNGYTEPEIKDRVMHFMEDAIKLDFD